ncbi:MAG: hypothetical protein AMXMBFR64_31450 [Myxococcales bacterium]
MKLKAAVVGAALALVLGGCDSDSDGGSNTGGGGGGGGGSDAAATDDSGGGGADDSGGGGGGGGGVASPLAGDPKKLHEFLFMDEYKSWSKESAVHDSAAHSKVLVFINDVLEGSLKAGNASHPMGSIAVKELYKADGTTVEGWAVMIKGEGTGGDAWYWYETKDLTGEKDPIVADYGASSCTGCHASGGSDFFKTPYPLQ